MQKTTNRILSALLVLVMVLSMLPATVFATSETDALKGWSIALGDDIGVKFHLNSADYTVTATVNGAEVSPVISDDVATVNVAAAQMTDTIVLTVKNGEETVHTGEYSVRQYAETILTGEYDVEVKEMVKEMLNYGAAAQTYFNYNTGNLANAGYELETAAAIPTEVPEITPEDNLDGVSLYGMSLVFRSKVAVRFYFKVDGDIADYTFSQGDPVEKDNMYYVEVGNINPQDLETAITMEVSKGEDKLSVSYSPLNYIVRKYNNAESSDSLKALVQAMYGYHVEAEEYASIIWAGTMSSHSNGWSADALYFSMTENAAPIGDGIRYVPTAESNIKLIRGGVTYDVAHTARESLVKSNETGYYIPLWVLGDYKPLVENDILIVSGSFKNAANNTTINISKSYVLINADGTAEFSTEMPTLPTTIEAGVMSKHSANGWQSNGVYASMAENDAPYDGWSVEYTPVAAENLKLIRGGETYNIGIPGRGTLVKYNATDYFLKMEWNVGDYAPMQDGDVLIVEGGYVNAASKVTLNISKTYIYANGDTVEFSTEMPTLPTTIEAGVMSKHSANGWQSSGVYASMAENDAPYDGWSVEYTPVAAENLKLIRGGETYNIGIPGRGTLVKYNATDYFLKMEWNVGQYAPMQDGDILIVEGGYVNEASKVTLNISKTYIYANGDTVEFSTEMPTLPSTVEGGVMQSHPNGLSGNGIYFKLDVNAAPYDGWSYEYAQTAISGIKLIRDGVTTDIGIVDRPLIVKYSDTEYYLKLEKWTIGEYGINGSTPITTDDVLIIEGDFKHAASNVTLSISKSYIYYDGSAWICAANLPVEVDCGVMSEHADGTPDEIYFSMAENSVPVDEEIAYPYAGTVQLVTGSNVETANAAIYKIADDQYYLELDGAELADGSYLIVEGGFANADNGITMNISKTYVLADGDSLVYSETEPVFETEFALTGLTNHPNGWTADGIYISHDAHEATVGTDWSVRYRPVSAEVIKLVRGGETFSIGQPAGDTLVVYGNTNMYFETKAWTTQGGKLPFVDGDMIVIEGKFKHEASGDILVVEKTVICVSGTSLIFNPIFAGNLDNHANGVSGEGIYATMAENAAPYDGWSIEYTPVTAESYYVIRNGEKINIGIPGRGTLVKYSATDYFLKINAWCTDNFAYTTDDIIVVEGFWKNDAQGVIMKMDTTYLYYDGSAWVCSAEAPVQKNIVDVVELGSHGNGWTTGGFYFTAAANNAPYDGWSLRYKPVSADVIKCISGNTTTNVGNTGGETIVKYSETEYYVEGWAVGSANLVAGNTFVIEGQFYNAANDVYIDVEKTYITLNADGSTTIITDSDKYINAGAMSAYTSNWFGDGIYFALGNNIAPAAEDWTIRYMPKNAANIKLVRNGQTYNIANTGAETIVKIADGQYWLSLESWWWNAYAPIVDGDILIIEGEFANASNGYTLNIDKTYITFVSKENDEVVFSVAADTEFGEVLLPNSADTLTIGMWNGSYHVFEDKQLKELQAAGITKIMGINTLYIGNDTDGDGSISDAEVSSWLDRVYSYGISVIIDLRDWDGTTVPGYASHEGLIGFLMYDEPCATDFDNLATLKAKFDAVMPEGTLFYVNLFPSCAGGTSLVGTVDWALGRRDYDTYYVQKFLDKLGVEVLSWDNYSLLDGNGIRTDYFYNFEVMASKNVPMWYTMLSSGHSTTSASYATPTEAELRWQMAVAMTYGVQNIDHYTYVSHESDYSCMVEYETWEPTDLYYDILKVDNEYLAWDNIFMAYDWDGVAAYSANSNNAMLTKLKNPLNLSDYGASVTSADQNLLVGVFDYNGDKAYMVTNAGSAGTTTVGDGKNFSMSDATVTLTLADGDYKCVAVVDNGQISYVAVENNTVTLNVQAYEGVFVIPVLN